LSAESDPWRCTSAVSWFLLSQVLGGVLANIAWARLVDRSGSRRMLVFCAIVSTLTPLSAIFGATLGWQALMLVFFLAGATFNGRKVGFQSALI
jgi:MFS family permease